MSEDYMPAEEPEDTAAPEPQPPPCEPLPASTVDCPSMPVEQWAEHDPIKGVSATMVLAQGGWAQGKAITNAQWRATANAILETPIGFKN